jgi:hypothetical protein
VVCGELDGDQDRGGEGSDLDQPAVARDEGERDRERDGGELHEQAERLEPGLAPDAER